MIWGVFPYFWKHPSIEKGVFSLVDWGEGFPKFIVHLSLIFYIPLVCKKVQNSSQDCSQNCFCFAKNFPQDCIRSQIPNRKRHTSSFVVIISFYMVCSGAISREPPLQKSETPHHSTHSTPPIRNPSIGCPAGTDRNDPKFVSWVVSPTNGDDLQPTYI